jgi:hypothetical protein
MVEGTNHLTLLDLLDVLEDGIVVLRGKNESLTAELLRAGSQGASVPPQTPARTRATTRKSRKKPAKRRKAGSAKKPPRAARPDSLTKEERALGKRQALGRSLLQLRKTPADSQPEKPETGDNKLEWFHH